MEHIPNTAKVAKNLRLDRSWLREKTKCYYSDKITIKWLLMTLLHPEISVSLSPHQEDSSFGRWGSTQRPTSGQCADSESFGALSPKWNAFIKPLLSRLRGEEEPERMEDSEETVSSKHNTIF